MTDADSEIRSPASDTETLLNELIAECRRLVRDVAIPSMAATSDALERMRFIESAVSLVKVGARVGDTVARLRGGNGETRHRMLVEHVAPQLAAPQAETRSHGRPASLWQGE